MGFGELSKIWPNGEQLVTEKKFVELGVAWRELSAAQARMADVLRVFVVTWDPLESLPGRPAGFATANAAVSGLDELVVYVPVWSLVELATERDVTLAAVLSSMAGSAVVTAAAHEQSVTEGRYPDVVVAHEAPDLLSDPAAGAALGSVDVRLVSDGWKDIGLGAITDVVPHAFGPVDLDRSLVELAARSESLPGCPACAGYRFGFPAELAEARSEMCPAHQREAGSVINRAHRPGERQQPGRMGSARRRRCRECRRRRRSRIPIRRSSPAQEARPSYVTGRPSERATSPKRKLSKSQRKQKR